MKYKGTLAVALILIAAFIYLSGGSFFIDLGTLYKLAFTANQPLNLLAHMTIHTGYAHLIENLTTFIVFALIAETVLVSADIVIIFFLSGAAAAILFIFLNPNVALIGASAGISGILGNALVLNPKKAIPALILVPLLLSVIILPLATGQYVVFQEKLDEQKKEISTQVVEAEQRGDVNAVKELTQQLVNVEQKKVQQEQGVQFQSTTPSDAAVHGFGALFGILYVFILRQKKLEEGVECYKELYHEILVFFKLESKKK